MKKDYVNLNQVCDVKYEVSKIEIEVEEVEWISERSVTRYLTQYSIVRNWSCSSELMGDVFKGIIEEGFAEKAEFLRVVGDEKLIMGNF